MKHFRRRLLEAFLLFSTLLLLSNAASAQMWVRLGLQGVLIGALAEVDDSTLLASGPQAMYRSTDRGETWQTVANAGGVRQVVAGTGGLVVACGNTCYMRSSDYGATWTILRDQALRDSLGVPWAVLIGEGPASIVYMGTTAALLRSTDGGATWSERNGGLPENYPHIGALAMAPDATIYAGSQGILGGNIYASANSGDEWLPILVRPEAEDGDATAIVATSSGTVLAGYTYRGILRTTDKGDTWSNASVSMTLSEIVRTMSTLDERSFAITMKGRILYSTDDGASWTDLAVAGLAPGGAQSLIPLPGNRILAGTSSGVYQLTMSLAVGDDDHPVGFVIAPNPAVDGTVRIHRSGAVAARFEIFDAAGRLVADGELPPGVSDVSRRGLSPGAYRVRVTERDAISTRLLIVR